MDPHDDVDAFGDPDEFTRDPDPDADPDADADPDPDPHADPDADPDPDPDDDPDADPDKDPNNKLKTVTISIAKSLRKIRKYLFSLFRALIP